MSDLSLLISDKRGKTPENIKSLALQLCKDYLGFAWNRLTENQLILWRISGGSTNQLYYCAIPDSLPLENDEPREVALKIYMKKHYKINLYKPERFPDTIVSIYAANHGLGPKIYGTFSNGQIEEYIRGFKCENEHMDDENILKEIAQKLAKYHFMKILLIKNTKWYPRTINAFVTDFNMTNETHKNNYRTVLNLIDVSAESEWILNCVQQIGSSIVFSHNDFSSRNIIVIDSDNDDNRIKFCDFEYSCFTCRGYDFGNFFAQWKMISFDLNIASDDIIEKFAQNYLNSAIELNGKRYANDPINNAKQLVNETKIFRISWFFMIMIWLMQDDEETHRELGMTNKSCAKAAEHMAKQYLQLKELFINNKIERSHGKGIRIREGNS